MKGELQELGLRCLQVRRHRADAEHRAGAGRVQRARECGVSGQPARLAPVGRFAVQAVREEVGHHGGGGAPKVHRPGADETRLHVRGRVQRRRLPGVRPGELHDGTGGERDGGAGDGVMGERF